jgi:hypothetical protein
MAKGGSLIFALIATSSLNANLNAIRAAADAHKLSAETRQRAAKEIAALPESGLDWKSAWLLDSASTEVAIKSVLSSKDPAAEYHRVFGEPLPPGFTNAGGQPLQQYREFINRAADALQLSPVAAGPRLDELEKLWLSSKSWYARIKPSAIRLNNVRKEIASARDAALQSVLAE